MSHLGWVGGRIVGTIAGIIIGGILLGRFGTFAGGELARAIGARSAG